MNDSISSYKDAVQYLYSLQKFGIKFGLSTTANLVNSLGNPHHGRKYIHIAGSNGKGSVAAMLESILIQSGLKVGFYSSPHLVRFTERFRINREEISREKTTEIIMELKALIDPDSPPTVFEVTTAMALIYFARQKTDIDIMEVGMGGRLDATNIVNPQISIITNISLEHQEYLGTSLTEIAGEKAGIIKPGIEVITAAAQPVVINLFKKICKEKKSPFFRTGKDVRYRTTGSGLNYYGLKRRIKKLKLGLKGKFQNRNAALALGALEILEKKGFSFSEKNIRKGLIDALWPGRMHIIEKKPMIILDGAHNPNAIKGLISSIKSNVLNYQSLILVIGVMDDKDTKKILDQIVPMADNVIYSCPDYYRAADPEKLMKQAAHLNKPGEVIRSLPEAIKKAKTKATTSDLILITGSLFTVGEALTCFDSEKYAPDKF